MRSLRWGAFADVAVRQMCSVKPGEKLLVLADTWTDMDLAEACLQAALAAGARAQLLVIPRMAPNDPTEFNECTAGAIAGADIILGVCATMFLEKKAVGEARKRGLRIASTNIEGMENFAIEGICDVDYPLMIKIAEKVGALWQKTAHCRVTSPLGTDISFDLRGRPIDIGDGVASRPGEADFFPGVSVANAPIESTINGVLVVDGNIPPGRLVREPVTVHLRNGVITGFEGGADARDLEAYFERSGDPVAKHLCHFTLGLNPRARTTGSVHQDEHVLGAITFGFGEQDPGFGGNVPPCSVHCDLVLTHARVEIDGKVMCEANKLNPDLGLGGLR
jgi:leucyl aminopeptidase (aminopeptidase T)